MASLRPPPMQPGGMPTPSSSLGYGAPPPPAIDGNELTLGERILVGATPLVTVGALIGLGYPPYAALTRWRICHNPKDSPSKTNYWKVLKAVKQKEGIKGLYKGLLPNLSVGIAPWTTVLLGYGILRAFPRAAPYLVVGTIAQFGWQAVTTLITLPFEILAVRTLAVPHSTPIVSPLSNLRLLLTADERAHPFKSLWTPSRILASFLPTLIAPLSATFLLPTALSYFGEEKGLLVYLASQLLLAVGIRTPLAVLASRLNAQRTGGTGAAIVHEKGADTAAVEGVVQIRPTPYRNLWDCAQTIVAEEGWYALWRGWPLELLLALRTSA